MKTKTAYNLSDTSYSEHAVSNELLTRSGGVKKAFHEKKKRKKGGTGDGYGEVECKGDWSRKLFIWE